MPSLRTSLELEIWFNHDVTKKWHHFYRRIPCGSRLKDRARCNRWDEMRMTHTGLGFPAHKLKCVVYPFTPLTLTTREALLPTLGIRQTDFTTWLLRMILRFRRHITLQLTLKRGALRFYMESDGEATNPRPDASTTGQWNSSGGGANS